MADTTAMARSSSASIIWPYYRVTFSDSDNSQADDNFGPSNDQGFDSYGGELVFELDAFNTQILNSITTDAAAAWLSGATFSAVQRMYGERLGGPA